MADSGDSAGLGTSGFASAVGAGVFGETGAEAIGSVGAALAVTNSGADSAVGLVVSGAGEAFVTGAFAGDWATEDGGAEGLEGWGGGTGEVGGFDFGFEGLVFGLDSGPLPDG